jgi:DNA-binding transcriptional ArsR family regulator
MDVEPSIAHLGALIGVPSRANILSALFDGRALTATELAQVSGTTAQTTSSHLAKLVAAALLSVERHGRFRYYKLAGPQVAEALEPLTSISPHRPVVNRKVSEQDLGLREARFCYDHFAGELGVSLTESMLKKGYLEPSGRDFSLSAKGSEFCGTLGIDQAALYRQRRVFARQCLDWSERKPHVAGALGAAIAETFIGRGWVVREQIGRRLFVTTEGKSALQLLFGIES